jgi:uncharacterized membrane protein
MNRNRLPYIARIVHARPRLFGSILLGAIAFFLLLQTAWALSTRILVAWDVGVGLYLLLCFYLMAGASPARIRQRAAIEDEGQFMILFLSVAAAMASLFAILIQLGVSAEQGRHPAHLIFATATIILSWFFMHSIFAVHYAHEFYGDRAGKGSGLKFPGDHEPDYWDFVYFSFVIGMTSQVSDVAVAHKPIRRLVTAHGVLSFFFNMALLALTFNIAATAIQK